MIRITSLLLAPFVWFAFAAPCQSPANGVAKAGLESPAVKVIDAAGLTMALKREPASNRPLLVNYWATWCDPCRDEFPDLVKIDAQYRDKLDFIVVSLDDLKDLKTEVPKFLQKMQATMPAYLLNVDDPEPAINSVDREWGGALPATFLYNSKGKIIYKRFGRVREGELRTAINKLLAETN